MIYELRVYDTTPGKLPALLDRFEKVNVPFFAKQGIGMFGFWTDDIGVSNRLTYIVTFDSMGDRERKWDAFQADPEWQKLRQEERQRDGEWVIGLRNTLMRLTPYSPEPRITTNIQELRVYDAMPAKLPAVNDRFANYTGRFFKKHGIEEIGYWTDVIGTGNQLWYMLGYDDLGERQQKWDAYLADTDWHKVRAESEVDGALVSKSYNSILRPTAFSPRG